MWIQKLKYLWGNYVRHFWVSVGRGLGSGDRGSGTVGRGPWVVGRGVGALGRGSGSGDGS